MAEQEQVQTPADVKPGWQTSEFWIQLVFAVLGLGMLSGKITPSETSEMTNAVSQVASLAPTVMYIIARWKTKSGNAVDVQALLNTLSSVAQTQIQNQPTNTNNQG